MRLIRVFLRLVLHVPQLLGFLADALGHCLLLVRKALDPVHHLIALAVERRIKGGEQRLRFLLLFRIASDHIVRNQFPRLLHRRATGGEPRHQLGFLCIDGFGVGYIDRGTRPDARDRNLGHF